MFSNERKNKLKKEAVPTGSIDEQGTSYVDEDVNNPTMDYKPRVSNTSVACSQTPKSLSAHTTSKLHLKNKTCIFCVVCPSNSGKNPELSFFRIPKDDAR